MTECKQGFWKRPWWVRCALLLQWVVIPALVFKGVSLGVHRWIPSPAKSPEAAFWQMRGQQVCSIETIDCAFLGSSRVMAAVDERTFAAELARHTGRPVHPLNLGLAYSTVAEQYFLVRNLFREHPERMRGCTVFIEAPAGLPADSRAWADCWLHPDRPDILPPLLRMEDVLKAWTCGMPLEERLKITKDYFCRRSTLLAQRTRVVTTFVEKGTKQMHRILDRHLPPKPPCPAPSSVAVDLTSRGGIRTDEDGIALARRLAVDNAKREIANQGPLRLTEQHILWNLVALIRREGGRVVFFEMPMHSIQRAPLTTAIRAEDRKAFHGQIRSWGAFYLANPVPTVDEDFPDIWHLRQSLAAPFSSHLARSWAAVAKQEGVY